MNIKLINWVIFISLCIIWGSSFILMKWGLYDFGFHPILNAYQVAALRLLSAGLIMLPFFPLVLKNIPIRKIGYVLLSGWLGSFFPAFLFCIAETKIDSAFAGSLNSLTPLFVIFTGALFFNIKTDFIKLTGVFVGLLGSALLIYINSTSKPLGNLTYVGFVLLATIFYGFNVNMVHKKMTEVSALQIACIAFVGLIIPSFIVLLVSGYFKLPLFQHAYIVSTFSSCILGISGTALASYLFYILVKNAGGLLASLVTYGIPFVAIGWGLYYGEKITWLHILALSIILVGVFLANSNLKKNE